MTLPTRARRAQVKKVDGTWTVFYHHDDNLGHFQLDWPSHERALQQALRWTGLAP